MSWDPDTEEKRLQKQRDDLRDLRGEDEFFPGSVNVVHPTTALGSSSGLATFNFGAIGDALQQVPTTLITSFNHVNVEAAWESITDAAGNFDVHFLDGAVDGQTVNVRPAKSKSFTLKAPILRDGTDGNLNIGNDISLDDTQTATFRFQEEITFGPSTDTVGTWTLESTSGTQVTAAAFIKEPARAATTADIPDLANASVTQDGVTLVQGDRVLVKAQITGSENGIYVVGVVSGTAPFTRATDFDSSAEVFAGLLVMVEEGTTFGDTMWSLSTDNPIVLDTTALTFITPSGADNLGNHIATQNLNMGGFNILNLGSNTDADSGTLRIGNDIIGPSWRNQANNGNIELKVDITDVLDFTDSSNGVVTFSGRAQDSSNPDRSFLLKQYSNTGGAPTTDSHTVLAVSDRLRVTNIGETETFLKLSTNDAEFFDADVSINTATSRPQMSGVLDYVSVGFGGGQGKSISAFTTGNSGWHFDLENTGAEFDFRIGSGTPTSRFLIDNVDVVSSNHLIPITTAAQLDIGSATQSWNHLFIEKIDFRGNTTFTDGEAEIGTESGGTMVFKADPTESFIWRFDNADGDQVSIQPSGTNAILNLEPLTFMRLENASGDVDIINSAGILEFQVPEGYIFDFENDANPNMDFISNKSGDGNSIFTWRFRAQNAALSDHEYSKITPTIVDNLTGTEQGGLEIALTEDGTEGVDYITLNAQLQRINFRREINLQQGIAGANLDLNDHYAEFAEISGPGGLADNCRLYSFDKSGTTEMAYVNSAGAVRDLSAAFAGAGDDLGSHIATADLNMAGNDILNVGANTSFGSHTGVIQMGHNSGFSWDNLAGDGELKLNAVSGSLVFSSTTESLNFIDVTNGDATGHNINCGYYLRGQQIMFKYADEPNSTYVRVSGVNPDDHFTFETGGGTPTDILVIDSTSGVTCPTPFTTTSTASFTGSQCFIGDALTDDLSISATVQTDINTDEDINFLKGSGTLATTGRIKCPVDVGDIISVRNTENTQNHAISFDETNDNWDMDNGSAFTGIMFGTGVGQLYGIQLITSDINQSKSTPTPTKNYISISGQSGFGANNEIYMEANNILIRDNDEETRYEFASQADFHDNLIANLGGISWTAGNPLTISTTTGSITLQSTTGNTTIGPSTTGSLKLQANSLGFYDTFGTTKPTVSGARNNGEGALLSLLNALSGLGLITNSTTAT